jgi:hypothetical protein
MIAACRNLCVLSKSIIPGRAAAQLRAVASSFSAHPLSLKPKFHGIFNLQPFGSGIFGIKGIYATTRSTNRERLLGDRPGSDPNLFNFDCIGISLMLGYFG